MVNQSRLEIAPPNPSPKPRRRREQYLDAAASIFFRRGYDSATMQDVADAVNVTKAAVYYHFASKEDLLYELIHRQHVLNMANLEKAKETNQSILGRLQHYFESHARLNLERLEPATLIYRDLDYLSVERRREIVKMRDDTQDFVRNLLKEGQKERSVCPKLNIRLASTYMFSTINGMYAWYSPTGPSQITELSEDIANFVVSAVSCESSSEGSCPRCNL